MSYMYRVCPKHEADDQAAYKRDEAVLLNHTVEGRSVRRESGFVVFDVT
jgi:hypothetical protein